MEKLDAATMIFWLFEVPLCTLLGYITHLGYLPRIGNSRDETRFLMTLMFLPVYILTTYRYLFYSKVKKNNYEIFRKKWGNESSLVRNRRKWLIIALFLFTCVILPLIFILLP